MTRTIGVVQEIDFIARGFNIAEQAPLNTHSSPTPGLPRQRKNSVGQRKCRILRSRLLTVLDLSLSIYQRSYDELSLMCNRSDLDKYFDIYDLNSATAAQNDEDGIVNRDTNEKSKFGDFEDESDEEDEEARIESLFQLKQRFRKLHHTRRKFLCCLLAMEANGDSQDSSKWDAAVRNLGLLSELVSKSSADLEESLLQEDVLKMINYYAKAQEQQQSREDSNDTKRSMSGGRTGRRRARLSSEESFPSSNRWRFHLQALSSMSATLRNLEAKICMLREDSMVLERQEARRSQQRQVSPSANSGSQRNSIDGFLVRSNSGLPIDAGPGCRRSAPTPGSVSQAQYTDSVIKQYNSLGNDICSLLREWENGKTKLYEAVKTNPEYTVNPNSGLLQQQQQQSEMTLSSPSLPILSSPNSLVSGMTSDRSLVTGSPWSPQSFDGKTFSPFTPRVRNLDNRIDDDYEADDDDFILETEGTPLPLAMRSKMVDGIASAMVRHQDRTLRAQKRKEEEEE